MVQVNRLDAKTIVLQTEQVNAALERETAVARDVALEQRLANEMAKREQLERRCPAIPASLTAWDRLTARR